MKKQLGNQELRELNAQLSDRFNLVDFFSKKDRIERLEDEVTLIIKDSEPQFFYKENRLFPTLQLLQKTSILKTVSINMPAVPFIVGGADIMRPGIVAMDDFPQGAILSIVDEKNKKPVAVGIALVSSTDMKTMEKGKVIKNIHCIGDEIWKKA